jgi:nuclear transport factor 2 (NTF2) superfamily protein
MNSEKVLRRAYADFNARNLEAVLAATHPDVVWPNGMEGGMVVGHAGIRDYWTRQWSVVDPLVEPLRITTESDGRAVVDVRQRVRDLAGNLLKSGIVQHVYQFESGLIKSMEIREQSPDAGSP